MIVPIVEGQSEVRAVGPLTRRVLFDLGVFHVSVAKPFRVKRNRVVRPGELERTIVQAERSRPGASAIMVLLDADTDCPALLGADLRTRAQASTSLTSSVVFPMVEIEAWVLAGIESVRGVRGIAVDAMPPSDPEAVRDAKGALSDRMGGSRGYVATDDLPAFFDAVDLNLVASRSASFEKFRRDLTSLAGA